MQICRERNVSSWYLACKRIRAPNVLGHGITSSVRCKYMYLVLWRDNSYFLNPTPKNLSETDIIKMLEFLIDNIPAALAYYVHISPLIRYSSVSGSYHAVLDIRLLLTWKLLNQGFLVVELNSSLWMFYGRHHDLVNRYGVSVSQGFLVEFMVYLCHKWLLICSVCCNHDPFLIYDFSPGL